MFSYFGFGKTNQEAYNEQEKKRAQLEKQLSESIEKMDDLKRQVEIVERTRVAALKVAFRAELNEQHKKDKEAIQAAKLAREEKSAHEAKTHQHDINMNLDKNKVAEINLRFELKKKSLLPLIKEQDQTCQALWQQLNDLEKSMHDLGQKIMVERMPELKTKKAGLDAQHKADLDASKNARIGKEAKPTSRSTNTADLSRKLQHLQNMQDKYSISARKEIRKAKTNAEKVSAHLNLKSLLLDQAYDAKQLKSEIQFMNDFKRKTCNPDLNQRPRISGEPHLPPAAKDSFPVFDADKRPSHVGFYAPKAKQPVAVAEEKTAAPSLKV